MIGNKNHYYPDVQLFLILIPFISAFNYYLTYNNISFNGFLLLTFSIDTLQGYMAWLGVRLVIVKLDQFLPYQQGLVKRLIIQFTFTLVVGLAIISVLTELVSFVAKGKPAPLDFYLIDLFIISIWFFVINGIYLGIYFYRQYQLAEAERRQAMKLKAEGLIVRLGKQEIRLDYNELEGFFVDEDYAVACQLGGKKYLLSQSLDKIESAIPPDLFFRLNRQYIAHRQTVSGFKRAENGKIIVQLVASANLPQEIPVSRLKAPAFKAWFQPV